MTAIESPSRQQRNVQVHVSLWRDSSFVPGVQRRARNACLSRRLRERAATPSTVSRAVLEDLWHLTALKRGWDSYDGLPTTRESISTAFTFLTVVMSPDTPPPSLVPLNDGGVQIEWHQNGIDIEASFPAEDEAELFMRDIRVGNMNTKSLDPGLIWKWRGSSLRGSEARLGAVRGRQCRPYQIRRSVDP